MYNNNSNGNNNNSNGNNNNGNNKVNPNVVWTLLLCSHSSSTNRVNPSVYNHQTCF